MRTAFVAQPGRRCLLGTEARPTQGLAQTEAWGYISRAVAHKLAAHP
jgi:hypothetical protein